MPGVAYYGLSSWASRDLMDRTDELNYKYFIAPVVTLVGPCQVAGNELTATVRNIGGMTAHNVVVAALDGDRSELGRTQVGVLAPGARESVAVRLRDIPAYPRAAVLPGLGYTPLNPTPLEVMPAKQMRGLPVRVCWTPPEDGCRLDFVSTASGEAAFRLQDPTARGRLHSGTLQLPGLATDALAPGDYAVRMVDRATGAAKLSTTLTIVEPNARFYVTQVNGKTWTGEPQKVVVSAGDTFEVRWDMGLGKLSGKGAIFISAPGDDLKMPRSDGSYAKAPILRLRQLMRNVTEDPFCTGRWTWKTDIGKDDIIPSSSEAWISHKGDRGPDNARLCMSANPGEWRLWIGDGKAPVTPVPVVPAITVVVKP